MNNTNHIQQQVIDNYKKDENMMILVFAQWCVNHELDPKDVYKEAYPEQNDNTALNEVINLTVSKEEAGPISNETLLAVLGLFGNHDLALIITEKIKKMK
ncbi:hypothetical protein [Evansella halocellulosilytica]|uniref:hypothetical protein n=1 Tax=Evansella halocellulosilytica TaxID=2011013 RepID=UPI000BB93BD9|nr:hypothetical protein [Evansella halocellulosilytica]